MNISESCCNFIRGKVGLGRAVILIAIVVFVLTIGTVYYILPKSGFPGTKVIADHPEIIKALEEKRPLMIYFSSLGCPTCLMQDRVLSTVYPKYGTDVEFVYILLSNSTEKIFEDWSVIKVPTLIFADREGNVVSRFDGRYLDEGSLRAELERIK
ncbi:MAG: thioredoxin family protein [Candidatus Methanomethyliaceae archaeon]|nr:thioredoxin family protein [Candidatus Methanomethyliaceae archaeon]